MRPAFSFPAAATARRSDRPPQRAEHQIPRRSAPQHRGEGAPGGHFTAAPAPPRPGARRREGRGRNAAPSRRRNAAPGEHAAGRQVGPPPTRDPVGGWTPRPTGGTRNRRGGGSRAAGTATARQHQARQTNGRRRAGDAPRPTAAGPPIAMRPAYLLSRVGASASSGIADGGRAPPFSGGTPCRRHKLQA